MRNNGQWGPWRIGEWLTPILEDVDLLTRILNNIFVFVYVCIFSFRWFRLPSFTNSSRTRREFRSRYWASNKALIYFSAFFICVLLLSVLVLCSLLSFIFVCFLVLFFARTRRESKSRYWASNKDHFCCFVVRFAANSFLAGILDLGQRVSPPLSLFHCPQKYAGGALSWPRGWAGHPAGVYTHP